MGRAVQVELLMAGFTDSSGEPLASGKVYSYEAGTSTAKTLYTDQGKTTAATNPVILDAQGRALVFGEGAYKFVIKSSADVTLYTWDSLQYFYPDLAAVYAGTSTGAANVYAVTPSPAVTAYTDGLTMSFIANHATSAAATLNVSGLGAKAFVKSDGMTALTTGDITSGMIVNAQYVSGSNHFRLVNASGVIPVSGGGTGAATAGAARSNLGLGTADSPTFTAVTATTATVTTAVLSAVTAASVRTATSDGSDNAGLNLGHADSTRGASVDLWGNEHATQPGILQLRAGAGATVGLAVGITTTVQYDGTALFPVVDEGVDLGKTAKSFANVYADKFIVKDAADYTHFGTASDRRSIDPTAGGLTVQQVAEIVDTLVKDLIAAGILE